MDNTSTKELINVDATKSEEKKKKFRIPKVAVDGVKKQRVTSATTPSIPRSQMPRSEVAEECKKRKIDEEKERAQCGIERATVPPKPKSLNAMLKKYVEEMERASEVPCQEERAPATSASVVESRPPPPSSFSSSSMEQMVKDFLVNRVVAQSHLQEDPEIQRVPTDTPSKFTSPLSPSSSFSSSRMEQMAKGFLVNRVVAQSHLQEDPEIQRVPTDTPSKFTSPLSPSSSFSSSRIEQMAKGFL
ncbi:hypothetical protein PFISCL1PPCAC_22622, partial [Pristionchus fissidentatus]